MRKTDYDTDNQLIAKKFAHQIIAHLQAMAERKELSEASRIMGIQVSRLSEMAKGKRTISTYYLGKMLEKGIISMDHILQGKKIEDLSEEEQMLLYKLRISNDLVRLLMKAENDNKDVVQILKIMIGSKE